MKKKPSQKKPPQKQTRKQVTKPVGRAITSASGYRVAAASEAGRELLTVEAPDGRLCLKILLLPEGPVVEVQGQTLRVAASGELRLDCEDLSINARRDVVMRAGGVIETEAHAQRLRARLGDIALVANDDVTLDGERIMLNTPKAAPPAMPAPPAAQPGAQPSAAPRALPPGRPPHAIG